MQKALLFFGLGTVVSFLIKYIFRDTDNLLLELYYSVAYGFAWGLAYYLDTPKITLLQKLGVSFAAMMVLVFVGYLMFTLDLAIASIIKFSTVFVAYYLLASFKESKSLRQ